MSENRNREFAAQRHKARELALQMLYEADLARKEPSEVLARGLRLEEAPESVNDYAERLLRGAWEHRQEYDALISRAAPTWPLGQLATVDRNIMRLALYELLHEERVPVGAAINEAVELAKEYGGDASSRFINGVLGAIASENADPVE